MIDTAALVVLVLAAAYAAAGTARLAELAHIPAQSTNAQQGAA